ncbi:hypothetical protein EMCRGX_G026795 [Ephydatia muelleri]
MDKNSRKKKQKKKQGKGGATTDVDESAAENTTAATSSPDTATPRSRPLPRPPSHPPPPLPSGWQLINEEGQRPYFWNKETGESTWVRPVEEGKEGGGHTMEEDKHLISGTVAVASSGPGGETEHLFMKHTNWANQLETFLVRDHDLSGKIVIGIMSCNTLLVQPSIMEPPVMLTLLNTKLPEGSEDTALVKPLMDIWDEKITRYDLKIKIVFVKQMPKAPLSEERKQKLERLEQDPSTGTAIYFGLVYITLQTGGEKDLRCWLLEKGLISLHEAYKTEPKPNILEKAMKECCNAVHYSKIIWDKERMEGMSLYDTDAPENDLHMNRMDFNSIQMVTRARKLVNVRLTFLEGYVSFEALGINSDNTSCNLQVMLWDSEGNNLLSWMLKEGIAGLVGGSNYWNPETGKQEEKVRCLCPYGRSVTCDEKEYQLFQYSPLEWMLVKSEREAIRERNGMWAVGKSLSPAISRVGNGKRHIFIDNSNLWILQKKLSGKVQEKNDKFIRMDEMMSSGQVTIDESFSTAECKRFKNSYYDEDPACRTHFERLGDLLGFKKGHDPSPHIFGSVPPDNERVWYMYEEVFGPKCVHLTKRTKEGKSTREDQQLISVMLLTDYNKKDDLVLVAGDGGYCTSLMRLMEKAVKKGPGKVYVVSWGNCSIQLKHLRNVVFINLDPYLKYLEHVSDEGKDGGSQSGQCQDTEGEEDDETLQDGDDDDY